MMKITYLDIVEHKSVRSEFFSKLGLKRISKMGWLVAEEVKDDLVRLLVERDCEDNTEHEVIVIPKSLIIEKIELEEKEGDKDGKRIRKTARKDKRRYRRRI